MKIIDVPASLLEEISFQTGEATTWGAPEEIRRPLMGVQKFSPKLLPMVLRRRVYDVSHRMQCPPDFVAAGMMVMLGSVIGSRCAIRPKQKDDWTEHPNVWGGIISRPGKLKTPAVKDALSPLAFLERRAHEEYDQAFVDYTSRNFVKVLELEALQKQLRKQAGKGMAPPAGSPDYARLVELRKTEPEPQLRRYRTNDSTVEKLAELMSRNPRGMLVERDELVGLLATCSREGHEGDRTFYLEGWSGNGRFQQDRIGRGTTIVDRLCLAIFGTIQPGRLQEYMYSAEGGQNDGFLQRFQLLVYPDELGNWQFIDKAPDQMAADAVNNIVTVLDGMDFVQWGAQQASAYAAPYFQFQPAAQKLFNTWLTQLQGRIDSEEHELMAEHLSKFRKLVPALALIFHLVELADTGKGEPYISPQALGRAIRWDQYLESHARRIYGMGTDYVQLAAEALSKKIRAGELDDGFSERDVYRSGWAYLNDPELTHRACQELVHAAWLAPISGERVPGRPQSPRYSINPALKT